MVKSHTKVVYKPDVNSTTEYIIIVNPDQFKKWKAGDTTIALSEVVDSFQIFTSHQGSQGILGKPSKQELDTVFGSHKDVDCVEKLLKHGTAQAGDSISASTWSNKNISRGGGNASDGR